MSSICCLLPTNLVIVGLWPLAFGQDPVSFYVSTFGWNGIIAGYNQAAASINWALDYQVRAMMPVHGPHLLKQKLSNDGAVIKSTLIEGSKLYVGYQISPEFRGLVHDGIGRLATDVNTYEELLGGALLGGLTSPRLLATSTKLFLTIDDFFMDGIRVNARVNGEIVGNYVRHADEVAISINLPKSAQGKGFGAAIFREAVDGVDNFKALWVKSDIYDTGQSINLQRYNYWVDEKGLSPEAAAWKTWSGQQAKANGFKSVEVSSVENGVQAVFKK